MNIDIINIFRFHTRILQCILHGQTCTQSFRVSSRQVISIGRHSATYYFGINLSTTSKRMFQLFQYQATGTFTHHKSITARTKRT